MVPHGLQDCREGLFKVLQNTLSHFGEESRLEKVLLPHNEPLLKQGETVDREKLTVNTKGLKQAKLKREKLGETTKGESSRKLSLPHQCEFENLL